MKLRIVREIRVRPDDGFPEFIYVLERKGFLFWHYMYEYRSKFNSEEAKEAWEKINEQI